MTWTVYSLESPTLPPLLQSLDELVPIDAGVGLSHGEGTQDIGDHTVVRVFQIGYGDWEFDASGNVTKEETKGFWVADIAVDDDFSTRDLSVLEADDGWRAASSPPSDYANTNFGARNKNRRGKTFPGGPVRRIEGIVIRRHIIG